MEHVFLIAPIAQELWKQFAIFAGIDLENMHLQQLLITWWRIQAPSKLNKVLKMVPALVMWELWRRRNALRHDERYSLNWMSYQCHKALFYYIKQLLPGLKKVP